MARIGWRLFFIVLGLASSLWLLPWLKFLRRNAPNSESNSKPGLAGEAARPSGESTLENGVVSFAASATILQILRQRSAWGTFAGLFAYNYIWYFFITWLPFYLVRERQFSVQGMSIVSGIAFVVLACSALASGWLSDKWIAAGSTPTRVRKTFTGAGPVIASSLVLVGIVANHAIAVGILMLACIGLGMCTSNLWAVTQTLAGPATSGKWTGLQNFTGNLAGWIAPALIGLIVQQTGKFFWVFVITSVVSLLGAAAWIFLVDSIRPITWSPEHKLSANSSR